MIPSGRVIWITGLSGVGKSSLAAIILDRLRAQGRPAVLLDGDELRWVWGGEAEAAAGYSRQARVALALGYGRLAAMLHRQGLDVVVATISLFAEVHRWNRANLDPYVEVYLKAPIEELRRRDPKGLYRRHAAGEVADMAGLDFQVDEPASAELSFDFTPGQSVQEMAEAVMALLQTGTAS